MVIIVLFVQYYYEPHTRRKFRSLLSVQRHLAKEAGDDDISEKMISKDIKTDTVSSNFIFCNFFKYVFIMHSVSNI